MKLRTKITLLTTAIAVSVVFFTLLSIRGVITNAFREELEKRAVSVAVNLLTELQTIFTKRLFSGSKRHQ